MLPPIAFFISTKKTTTLKGSSCKAGMWFPVLYFPDHVFWRLQELRDKGHKGIIYVHPVRIGVPQEATILPTDMYPLILLNVSKRCDEPYEYS